MVATELITGMEDIINYLREVEEKNKKLEEENKQLKKENKEYEFESCESAVALPKLYGEINKLKETLRRWQQKADFNLTDSDEEEEEKCKYDNDDEWRYGYGFTSTDGEFRITMAGGGDHWYDYVINKDYCFIHSKEGEQKVRAFILSNPDIKQDYLKVIELNDPEYKLEEGEQNMFEMVEECYPEVFEYDEDESDEDE